MLDVPAVQVPRNRHLSDRGLGVLCARCAGLRVRAQGGHPQEDLMALSARLPLHPGRPCQRQGRISQRAAREVVTGE